MALYAGVRAGLALAARRPLAVSVRGLTLFFSVPVLLITGGSLWLSAIHTAPASEEGFLRTAAVVMAVFILAVVWMGRGVYVAGMGRETFLAALSKVLTLRGRAYKITDDGETVSGATVSGALDLNLQFYPEHALVLVNIQGESDARFLRILIRDLKREWSGKGVGQRGSLPVFLACALGLLLLTGWWTHARLPQGPEFWVDLGQGFVSAKRYDDAILVLDRAVEWGPGLATARTWRGTARHLAGDPAGAATDLEKGLALAPESPLAALHLARFLVETPDARLQNPERALALARSAAQREPQNPMAADTLALTLAMAKNFPAAALAQQKAIALLTQANAAPEVIEEAKKRLEDYRAAASPKTSP